MTFVVFVCTQSPQSDAMEEVNCSVFLWLNLNNSRNVLIVIVWQQFYTGNGNAVIIRDN